MKRHIPLSLIQLMIIPVILGFASPATAAKPNITDLPSFSIAEHVTVGNEINLAFEANTPAVSKVILHLPNGASISYGDAISFGDFYAVVGKPISKETTNAERKKRFSEAFNSFATSKTAVEEIAKLKNISQQEMDTLNKRMKNGEPPEVIYKSISNETGRQLNCATGGSCNKDTWWLYPGRYLTIANDNYDHFGNNAMLAYQAGHQVALEQALIAHQTGNQSQLEVAYAMNAFASHYLSDRFAAGHMRTPRNKLATQVTPALVGALLASYMHAEENSYGLHVHNKRNDHWVAYGDWYYFNKLNEPAKSIIRESLQTSADEIFNAFLYGEIENHDQAMTYIPILDEKNTQNNLDISPLFYWDSNKKILMRRTTMSDPYSRNWTSNWWGWSTLAELREERG